MTDNLDKKGAENEALKLNHQYIAQDSVQLKGEVAVLRGEITSKDVVIADLKKDLTRSIGIEKGVEAQLVEASATFSSFIKLLAFFD